ncbi:EamA family transporter [uncultured Anaerococcus sp.]|uniref:EamA family transporter n=1 Tax=uncultured Anaerococcus sp. TaxID=293428 RepID=UPI00280C0314|nr:EamA family transporter [uncultured Anaerococcus sp.]MDU5148725.1 EamA family transporter [Anaerococcus prevotii]
MWLILSILSAFFAAVTSILAKIGIENVNSNLATAIRTLVVVIMSWLIVFITNAQTGIHDISNKSWMFLILSGLATGLSWLCYYAAIKSGQVSKVVAVDKASVILTFIMAFIFLGEKFTLKSIIGAILIGIGTFIMVI